MKLRNLVFEEEKQTPVKQDIKPQQDTPRPSLVTTPTVVEPSSNTSAYDLLLTKTDFNTTDAGKTLKKYLDTLVGIALDERVKTQTAMAQAKALDGLTPSKVLGTFDSITNQINTEVNNFKTFSDRKTAQEIDARKQQIEDTQKQITELQNKQIQLTTDMANAQMKIDHAKADFQNAVAKRTAEINDQRAHYASILQ